MLTCWAEHQEKKFGDVWHCLSPPSQIILESECDNKYKCHHGSHTQLMLPQEFRLSPENCLSFGRLVRVTAWCLRFCQRLRNRGKIRREDDDAKVCIPVTVSSGSNAMVLALTAMIIRSAEMFWVSVAQREVYSDVIDVLQSAREMPQSAPLQKLCPQLDSTSGAPVLCVGGRLRLLTTLQELAL